MENFDLTVLGGGPAGYNAAAYAASKGLSVVLFEKNELGGVCLNEGCVPSKTLLNSAKVLNYFKHGENYGVKFSGDGEVSQEAVVDRKNKVVKRLVTGVRAKLKGAGVTVVKAEAKILCRDENGVVVQSENVGYNSKFLLIATGSSAFIPKIPGVDKAIESGLAITNREALSLVEIPKTLLIMGGGVIGLEMADYYSSVGSDVVVVEMLGKIAGATDEKVSAVLQKALEKKGVKFRLSSKVKEITENGAVVETENGEEEILADKILLSVGRRANVTGFGLENIGVETERGAIVTDSRLKTNVENVYAAGDVNGKSMLAHTAYREGEVAVNNMLNVPDEMNYDSVPSVIYTTPEVASAGYTLSAATEKGINADEVQLSLMYSGRYIAENTDYTGILKLVYDKDNNVLIGASVVGNYASEYIVAVSNLIDMKVDIDRAKKLVFPHPTVCEVVREGLFEIK